MTLNVFTDWSLISAQLDEGFKWLDTLNAEDYAYLLAHGEVPPAADLPNETEAA